MSLALIYAAVPKLACKGKCQASCGPIMASDFEVRHFEEKTGRPFPDLLTVLRGDLSCPYLSPIGGCEVYQYRPLICRLWGVVPGMPCPYGCVPERILTEDQSRELLAQADAL